METREELIKKIKRLSSKFQTDVIGDEERVDGRTPHGGAYSIAHYLDGNMRPCKKDVAEYISISEYTEDGEFINSVLGYIK